MTAIAPREAVRLPALDCLRGMAILMVLLAHFLAPLVGGEPVSHLVGSLGIGGVILFFLLSGYLIYRNLQRQPVLVFLIRRAFKLLPAYWIAIVLVIVLVELTGHATHPWIVYVANAFLIPDVIGHALIAGHFWTLVIEAKFYLLIAVQVLLFARFRAIAMISALILINLLLFMLHHRGSVLIAFLPVFYVGVEIFKCEAEGWSFPASLRLLAISAYVAASLLLFVQYENVAACIYTLVGALAFVLAVRMNWSVVWLQFLGRISYSLYLLHAIVGFQIVSELAATRLAGWPAAVIGVGVSVALVYVSFRMIEQPCVGAGRQLEPILVGIWPDWRALGGPRERERIRLFGTSGRRT